MKISVIVPVYGVEPYLEACLDSIREQTHQDLEVILVDDGSPDNCGAICDKYAMLDDRFQVIHKENGGVASARNAGLDAATGDYIGFVDPDDWIEPDMYEYMLEHALRYQADVVICDIRVLLNGQRIFWIPKIDDVIVQNAAQTMESCLNGSMHDGCVNKLYRRELWEGLRFPTYQMAEDLSALWEIYKRVKVSVRLPEDKYVYFRRSKSITMDRTIQTNLDDFRAIKKRHEEVLAGWSQFEELSARRCLTAAKGVWERCFYASKSQLAEAKPELREMAEFCIPYLKKYEWDSYGRIGRLQLRLTRYYPGGWALWLARLLNKMYKLFHRPAKEAPESCGSWVAYELTFDRDRIRSDSRDNLASLNEDLSALQSSRAYKWFLLRRRFSTQLIRGSMAEKKDFLCWGWSKFTHKDHKAKSLEEFDPLVNAKTRLRRAAYLDHMLVQADTLNNADGTFKNGKQVFIFAGVHYCDIGGGQRSAQLARTLNDMGYSVYYIYNMVHYLFNGPTDPIVNGEAWCPAILHYHVDDFSVSALKSLLREGALLIFEVPTEKYIPYLEYAVKNNIQVVYEHIDNWDSTLGEGFFQEEVFQRFLNGASLVTVTARLLGEKVQESLPGKEYLYLPNAVNSTLFEPLCDYEMPKDLIRGKKTLLYFGSLYGEWFDWEKVFYVAEHCDCEINLIGSKDWIQDLMKTAPSNIHFLGEKKQDNLPAYLAYSDIAILPFKNCEIGKYVSPLKIFEYIAMNKPVLATPLDDISGYPNVFASDDAAEWAKAVERDWPVTDAGVFTAKNSWYARCNALLKQTGMLTEKLPRISVIVHCQNDKRTICRCVSSLLAAHENDGCEIIVVDSGSDGSDELLRERFGTKIKLLKCGEEETTRGLEQAAEAAEGEYLFFLSGRRWVTSGTYLLGALEVMRSGRPIGAVSRSAGWFSEGKFCTKVSEELPHHGVSEPSRLFRTDVAYLSADGLLLRKSLYEKVDGFDQAYHDIRFAAIDLSLKIKHAGYELALCPYMQLASLPGRGKGSRGQDIQAAGITGEEAYLKEKWGKLAPDLLR